jgi:hypothetical protein
MAFIPRRAKRVRLREEHSDAIVYKGPDSLQTYLASLFAQLPIDTYRFELIVDFAKHRASLARALVEITSLEPPETVLRALQAIPGSRSKLLNYIMQCYVVSRRRASLLLGDGIAEAARHMWALFMHAYLDAARRENRVAREGTNALLATPSHTLPFAIFALRHGEAISVSDDPVQTFSVRTHWQAASGVVMALYAFPYSTDMYDYLRVLMLRHAQLLSGETVAWRREEDDTEDDAALAETYDHPLYCAPSIGRPYLRAGSESRVVLNDVYLNDLETLLGSQLTRLTRVRWLIEVATVTTAKEKRVPLDTAPTSPAWADALRAFTDALSVHNILRRDVVEKVKNGLTGTLLMHGETVRFMRAHPRQAPIADNVLATMRQNTYRIVAALMARPIADFVSEMLASQFAVESEEPTDWRARARPATEPEALLVISAATDVWLQYMGASPTFFEERVHLEEIHVGKDEMRSPFDVPRARPCWIRCMRWNFVLDSKDAVRYAGTNVVAAYAAWLTALFRGCPDTAEDATRPEFRDCSDNGKGVKLTKKYIHAAWQPLLVAPVSTRATSVSEVAPGAVVFA